MLYWIIKFFKLFNKVFVPLNFNKERIKLKQLVKLEISVVKQEF